jgi:hypothetical protein
MKHELMKYLVVIAILLHPLATLYCGWLIITKIELEKRAPNLFGFLLGIVFYAIVKNLIESDYLRAFFKGLFLK